jgi:hypothetical protein
VKSEPARQAPWHPHKEEHAMRDKNRFRGGGEATYYPLYKIRSAQMRKKKGEDE